MIWKNQERWWERIIRLEPRLSSYEARSRIEAVVAAFVQAKAFQKKRSLKRPWGFRYQDAANMRKRRSFSRTFRNSELIVSFMLRCDSALPISIPLQDICANWNLGQSKRKNGVANAKDCCRNSWHNLGPFESHSPESR